MAVILVVDDDLGVRESVTRYLIRRGHSAVGAATGAEAVRRGKERRPHVAILDLRLPDSDGLSIFTSLRRDQPALVGVIVTGYATVTNAVACLKAGIADYLEKPVSLEALAASVERLVERPTPLNARQPAFVVLPIDRLARAIVMAVNEPATLRTLGEWGHAIGVARGTLRAWCYAAGAHPNQALAFTRGLVAVHRAPEYKAPAADLLGFRDVRSIGRFLERSGPLDHDTRATSEADYCRGQRFLVDERLISAILELLPQSATRANDSRQH